MKSMIIEQTYNEDDKKRKPTADMIKAHWALFSFFSCVHSNKNKSKRFFGSITSVWKGRINSQKILYLPSRLNYLEILTLDVCKDGSMILDIRI